MEKAYINLPDWSRVTTAHPNTAFCVGINRNTDSPQMKFLISEPGALGL